MRQPWPWPQITGLVVLFQGTIPTILTLLGSAGAATSLPFPSLSFACFASRIPAIWPGAAGRFFSAARLWVPHLPTPRIDRGNIKPFGPLLHVTACVDSLPLQFEPSTETFLGSAISPAASLFWTFPLPCHCILSAPLPSALSKQSQPPTIIPFSVVRQLLFCFFLACADPSHPGPSKLPTGHFTIPTLLQRSAT